MSRCSFQTMLHLVKTYGRLFIPWRARATISSEWPSPYAAAVSIQLMPVSSASRMAAIESRSSWAPQANSQPPPPIAHAPKPIGVIVYSPMASGLLTGAMTPERIAGLPADDWRRRHSDFREPQLSRHLKLVRLLRAIGNHHGRSPGEVAVAWVLRRPAVTGAIVGARRPEQVRGLSGAAEFRLSPRELAAIEAFFSRATA